MTSVKFRNICALFLASAVFLTPPEAGASEGAPVLTLEDCLAVAESGHPDIAGANASAAIQRGRLAQSVASDRLEVSGSASGTRSGSAAGESSRLSLGAAASIKVYDANRNKYAVDASRYSLSASEAEALGALSGVRAGVKSAYLTLLLNMETARQRKDSVAAFEKHLEQARGFYEAGAKPWYDVTKAEVDLGGAQLSLVEAVSNIQTAKASLANAMGVGQDEEFEIAVTEMDILSLPEGAADEAESLALENRSDYIASARRIMAGRSSLSSEARSASPSVSLSGGYDWAGDDIYNLERGWNAGLRLSVPIIDGGAAKARLDTAQAQVISQEASHEKLKQDIMLDVSKAKTDITKALERIRISELTLVNALENRRMAEGRYETGVGDPLEVTDALLSYTDAILANKQAAYDFQMAVINLEKATGVDFQ
ncbi:MAG: TolC family protein [Synergistaceae bacterium]|nr:TolC family protein [Synergistaceae bacterium]